jgi:hypothetical protein
VRRSKNNPQCLEWYFLIINKDKREIPRITTAINNLFAPIVEEYRSYEGIYPASTFYNFTNFDSAINLDSGWKPKIFRRILRDNNLYHRKEDPDGLEKYISEIDSKI